MIRSDRLPRYTATIERLPTVGVEMKALKGRLRPEQTLFLERIRDAGGVGFVARNCRDVSEQLELAGKDAKDQYYET